MSGTKAGGLKAKATNIQNNPNFYREIGKIGGSKLGVVKGFALATPEQRREAGRIGGKNSRRTGVRNKPKV